MLPKSTPEQRAPFFEDVESLLTPGFLTHPAVVSGVRLQIRSLGPGDIFMLRARTEGANAHEWRLWALASAIWMVNGRSVLGRDDAVPFLYQTLENLPLEALSMLFSLLVGLWVRLNDAISDAQTYCYETNSRYRWKTLGPQGLSRSGVPGAETLGNNPVQRIWVAFNEMEDLRQHDDTQWEGFKLVASSNAPKAIRKLDERDSQRREAEKESRQAELDTFFYQKLGVVTTREESRALVHSHKMNTKSVEDLEEEMRRWVTGEHDHHDAIVAAYKEDIRQRYEAYKEAQEAHRLRLLEKRQDMGVEDTPQPLIAVTAEQLQHVLKGRGSRQGVQFIPAAPAEMYLKYLEDPSSGKLHVQDGRVINPEADSEKDTRTLHEMVKGRNPAFEGK